jgi:lysophospholipase L1-like esterase
MTTTDPQRATGSGRALADQARLAIIGDSITERRGYSKFMECHLLACAGRTDVSIFQFGWSGERACDFASRLAHDLAVFRPTAATICYGMNDAGYQPYSDATGEAYGRHMSAVIAGLREAGVGRIVVGSPGAVDAGFFDRPVLKGDVYNDALARLRDIARDLSAREGVGFADLHDLMAGALAGSKAALGAAYAPFGQDGFHPDPAGHLLMALGFLRALGVDGEIGRIRMRPDGTEVEASEGHTVLGVRDGGVEFESSRWPFCFDDGPTGTRSILPFCGFNEEMNRLVLVVGGLKSAAAKIVWGGEAMEFGREQLERGVNLAAEFRSTPFDADFAGLTHAVGEKQEFETLAIRNLVTGFRMLDAHAGADAGFAAARETVTSMVREIHALKEAAARRVLVPVRHRIRVEPLD